jgi:hypothetical protein
VFSNRNNLYKMIGISKFVYIFSVRKFFTIPCRVVLSKIKDLNAIGLPIYSNVRLIDGEAVPFD